MPNGSVDGLGRFVTIETLCAQKPEYISKSLPVVAQDLIPQLQIVPFQAPVRSPLCKDQQVFLQESYHTPRYRTSIGNPL